MLFGGDLYSGFHGCSLTRCLQCDLLQPPSLYFSHLPSSKPISSSSPCSPAILFMLLSFRSHPPHIPHFAPPCHKLSFCHHPPHQSHHPLVILSWSPHLILALSFRHPLISSHHLSIILLSYNDAPTISPLSFKHLPITFLLFSIILPSSFHHLPSIL